MRAPLSRATRGFTLIEMTLAMALTLGIAAAVIGMLQQQISFTGILARFQFLREDAPQINTLMTNLVNRSDSYRIYGSRANAIAATGAVQTGGRALRLRFREPDGTTSNAIISFEDHNGKNRLNFYYRPNGQTSWPTTPTFVISSLPSLVDFSNNTGILLVTMTGPNSEQITYAGNPE